MPVMEGAYRRLGSDRASYNFAVDGGATGNITLREMTVPAGATVLGGYIEVTTPLGSGGTPTVALQLESAADLQAATAFSGAPWSTAGRKSILPVFTGASSIRTTQARVPIAVVAAGTLTGGAFDLVLIWSEV